MFKNLDKKSFMIVGYVFVGIVAIACLLPFIMLISGSFTSEEYIVYHGYRILPHDFSLEAYKSIFMHPDKILNAYGITIFVTVFGTFLSLFLSTMTAYVLQRKDFEWRNKFSFYFYFTTLFSGGLTPTYILMMSLGMKNNIMAIIIPGLFNVFNILIIRNFMHGIPYEISESAKVDGAGDFLIYLRVILPMSLPVLATMGLFIGLAYWNEWYNTLLYISDERLYTLQYYLYNMLNSEAAMRNLLQHSGAASNSTVPMESTKLAMVVVATGPILLLYPMLQKYFVKGIVVGAVKG